MSQVSSVKALRDKCAKFLTQKRGQTPLVDIKSSSYSRPLRTTLLSKKMYSVVAKLFCSRLKFSSLLLFQAAIY